MERAGREARASSPAFVGPPFIKTLVVMTSAATDRRYVSEAVWLPTYIGVAMVVLGTVSSSWVATLLVVAALIGCRLLLELLYRMVFGTARLEFRTGLIAFGSQIVVWALIWAWHAQRSGA